MFEQIKLIAPLTDPTRYGGRAEDAFDVVIPSLPGFGFSARPTRGGLGARAHRQCVGHPYEATGVHPLRRAGRRLGCGRRSGDGAAGAGGVAGHPHELSGGGTRPTSARHLEAVRYPRDSPRRKGVVSDLGTYVQKGGRAYVTMMGARPQAVGYGMSDSPAGLAAFMLVHPGFDKWTNGKDPRQSPTRDDVLDNFTLYWLTNTAASAARIYWENRDQSW